jgi:predicted glycoside hydrolase/deacetylase ChbG (UPF0249 family)
VQCHKSDDKGIVKCDDNGIVKSDDNGIVKSDNNGIVKSDNNVKYDDNAQSQAQVMSSSGVMDGHKMDM